MRQAVMTSLLHFIRVGFVALLVRCTPCSSRPSFYDPSLCGYLAILSFAATLQYARILSVVRLLLFSPPEVLDIGLSNWLRQPRVGHTTNGCCPWQRQYVVEHQSGRNVGAVLTTVVKATVNST